MNLRLRALPALLLSLGLAACATTQPAAAPTPAPHDNLNAVLWMQGSLEYRLTAESVYRGALHLLPQALADTSWDALVAEDRHNDPSGLPPAIILDLDETVLDNSVYQARMILDGTEYGTASWEAWVEEAAAGAVPGALELTRAADALGITVIYITNRAHHQEAPTRENLRALGFPLREGAPVYLGLGLEVSGCRQARDSEKHCRRRLVAERYRVLMQFGDQFGDFVASAGNSPEARAAALAPYAEWIGRRWFMLPNPSYGYWEGALFGDDWSLPPEQRRQRKLDALEAAR